MEVKCRRRESCEKKNKNPSDCDSYLFYFHLLLFTYIYHDSTSISQRYSNINSCIIKLMKYYYYKI